VNSFVCTYIPDGPDSPSDDRPPSNLKRASEEERRKKSAAFLHVLAAFARNRNRSRHRERGRGRPLQGLAVGARGAIRHWSKYLRKVGNRASGEESAAAGQPHPINQLSSGPPRASCRRQLLPAVMP
jgi:hypothetical protein